MTVPTAIADIERMIQDQVQENIHLDYKDSRALARRNQLDIAKDASAFANSDGGILIYGVQEHEHLPTGIDDGVQDSEIRREWVEDALLNHITPRLDHVRVFPIPRAEGRSLYVIEIGKSFRGPHLTKSTINVTISNRNRWRTTRFQMFEAEIAAFHPWCPSI